MAFAVAVAENLAFFAKKCWRPIFTYWFLEFHEQLCTHAVYKVVVFLKFVNHSILIFIEIYIPS